MLLCALLATAVATSPGESYADDSERSVLVLRVAQEGKYSERLTKLVYDYLRKSAITLLPTGALTSVQRKCNEPACLSDLAKDALILTASVTVRDEDNFINVSVFDAKSGRNRTANDVCEQVEVERRLKALTGRLVDEAKGGTSGSAPPLTLRTILPEHPLAPAPLRLSTARRVVAGALLGTAALSLGSAITLSVVNSSRDCLTLLNISGTCDARATELSAAGYAVAGAALLGAMPIT